VLGFSLSSISAASQWKPSGVDGLVGDAGSQQEAVRQSLDGFYSSLVDPSIHDELWPSAWIDPAGIDGEPLDAVVARMRAPQLRSYAIRSMTSPTPGVWVVTVEEVRTSTRTMLVTMGLRMEWAPGTVRSTWMIVGYAEE
jgi:hypothetical protein